MLEGFISAISALAQINVVILLIGGSIIGLIFGALPGLGGIIAVSIILPFTFGWDPKAAIYLMIGISGSAAFGGSIPAILLNTPGTPNNAATCLDGYPMARNGEAGRALGLAASASLFGALLGVFVLVALIPVVRPLVLMFSAPEFVMLIILGLVAIAYCATGSMIKGLMSGAIGIIISIIGFSPLYGILRFNFGSEYLWDGITLVPFMIGIFAISELIRYSLKGGTISKKPFPATWRGIVRGFVEVFKYPGTFIRGSITGVIIGIIPGVGGTVANFLSYTFCRESSRHKAKFGTGHPEGIIASEAANDSKDGGTMLPTLAFGIPGSPFMALLLGAFILHGLRPGPTFLVESMDIAFVLIIGLVISNIFASTFGLMASKLLARVTNINVVYIAPTVLVLVCIGSFMSRGNIWDVVITLLAGVFGYALTKFGFSVICMVIGYVLGAMAERMFMRSLMISQGDWSIFVTRPITLALFIIVVIVLLLPFIGKMLQIRKNRARRSSL